MPQRPFPGTIGRTIADSQPWWPPLTEAGGKPPNVLVVLFDDVGFADFGCYGSSIRTPAIDALAARGLRLTGFHTTAMCSTTRAALMTGCNHHSVGMGCLANFDSGYPGYRGKIAPEAATLAEMLRPQGYANYMVGKWHVTALTETGPTGPFDGWPLGRGYDRFYGFMDAETDQYAPELVRDNTQIPCPGSFASGYHLSVDLVDQSLRYLADHAADQPGRPWHLWLAPGACHAPHQAPDALIRSYDPLFAHGWDEEKAQRLARQIALGIVPPGTTLPPPNAGVQPWASHAERFAENGRRVQGQRRQFVMHAGMGHLPNDVAPDLRGRDALIEAEVLLPQADAEGVLIAHGDATSGYSLYLQGGRLVFDLNVGGVHRVLRSDCAVPPGRHCLAVQMVVGAWVPYTCPIAGAVQVPQQRTAILLIDGQPAGSLASPHGFNNFISWSGLDIGLDRGSPVSHYAAPFAFTGTLRKVTVTLGPLPGIDGEALAQAEMARQ